MAEIKRLYPRILAGVCLCPIGCVPDNTGVRSAAAEARQVHSDALAQLESELTEGMESPVVIYLSVAEIRPYEDVHKRGFIAETRLIVFDAARGDL